jgi:hypothetical protein
MDRLKRERLLMVGWGERRIEVLGKLQIFVRQEIQEGHQDFTKMDRFMGERLLMVN